MKNQQPKLRKSHVAKSVKSRNLKSSVKPQQLKRQQTQGKLIELDLSQIGGRSAVWLRPADSVLMWGSG